jgi:hypothetical protein
MNRQRRRPSMRAPPSPWGAARWRRCRTVKQPRPTMSRRPTSLLLQSTGAASTCMQVYASKPATTWGARGWHYGRPGRHGQPSREAEEGRSFPAAPGAAEGDCRTCAPNRWRRRVDHARTRRSRTPRRRHRAHAERDRRAPLGTAARWRALRGHAAHRLGNASSQIAWRRRAPMSELQREAPRARGHHRARAGPAHSRAPGPADRRPAARTGERPDPRAR